MSRIITPYEKEVMARIDEIRTNQGFTEEDFAEYLGFSLETYKRCSLKKQRVPLDLVHAVMQKYPGDKDYILFGKKGQNFKFINTFVSGTDEERAQVFDELAEFYRAKQQMKNLNKDRRRRKAIEKNDVDYKTDEALIETPRRKTSTAAKKAADSTDKE